VLVPQERLAILMVPTADADERSLATQTFPQMCLVLCRYALPTKDASLAIARFQ
jgi:hypothetical protein